MHFGLLVASVLLVAAAVWSFTLLQSLRDWRAGFVIAWLAGVMVLLAITIRWQFAFGADGFGARPGEMRQIAISGLAIAAVLFFHQVFQHDPLTGLPNRTLFTKLLRQAIKAVNTGRSPAFAVLILDLDRFKVINDSLGPGQGDQLLTVIAQRLKGRVRPGDTVARLGSDEFVLLLYGVTMEDVPGAVDRLLHDLGRPIVLDGQEIVTTASIGVALSSSRWRQRPDGILRDADLAMSRAKAVGQSRYVVFDASMHEVAVERLKLESELRRAAERNELLLAYQPIVTLADGRVGGFEALLRWKHAERGIVHPDDFMPMAEETDLIVPIGYWVLEEACRQMSEWRRRFPEAADSIMHVNLSARQFGHEDLVSRIDEILRRTNLPAAALGLEITESVVMDDAERATGMLRELRALGIRLQVDDFGTGYSSLSYLSRLPIDTLKIDRSFVAHLGSDGDDLKIVRSIVTLARDMELDVIAEGVERPEHVAVLRRLGCHLGQGNYFQPAVSARELERMLERGRLTHRFTTRNAKAG